MTEALALTVLQMGMTNYQSLRSYDMKGEDQRKSNKIKAINNRL